MQNTATRSVTENVFSLSVLSGVQNCPMVNVSLP